MLKISISFIILVSVAASALKINPRGVVSPVARCGGLGQFTELRVPGCTAPPCQLDPNIEYMVEVDFIPVNSCSQLGFRLFILYKEEIHSLLDVPIPSSSVGAGAPYTVRYPLTPDDQLHEESFHVMIQIYCTTTLETELCIGCDAVLS